MPNISVGASHTNLVQTHHSGMEVRHDDSFNNNLRNISSSIQENPINMKIVSFDGDCATAKGESLSKNIRDNQWAKLYQYIKRHNLCDNLNLTHEDILLLGSQVDRRDSKHNDLKTGKDVSIRLFSLLSADIQDRLQPQIEKFVTALVKYNRNGCDDNRLLRNAIKYLNEFQNKLDKFHHLNDRKNLTDNLYKICRSYSENYVWPDIKQKLKDDINPEQLKFENMDQFLNHIANEVIDSIIKNEVNIYLSNSKDRYNTNPRLETIFKFIERKTKIIARMETQDKGLGAKNVTNSTDSVPSVQPNIISSEKTTEPSHINFNKDNLPTINITINNNMHEITSQIKDMMGEVINRISNIPTKTLLVPQAGTINTGLLPNRLCEKLPRHGTEAQFASVASINPEPIEEPLYEELPSRGAETQLAPVADDIYADLILNRLYHELPRHSTEARLASLDSVASITPNPIEEPLYEELPSRGAETQLAPVADDIDADLILNRLYHELPRHGTEARLVSVASITPNPIEEPLYEELPSRGAETQLAPVADDIDADLILNRLYHELPRHGTEARLASVASINPNPIEEPLYEELPSRGAETQLAPVVDDIDAGLLPNRLYHELPRHGTEARLAPVVDTGLRPNRLYKESSGRATKGVVLTQGGQTDNLAKKQQYQGEDSHRISARTVRKQNSNTSLRARHVFPLAPRNGDNVGRALLKLSRRPDMRGPELDYIMSYDEQASVSKSETSLPLNSKKDTSNSRQDTMYDA